MAEEFLDGETDVAGDLPEQSRRDVAPRVEGNGRAPTVGMPVLPMGAALPDLFEAETHQQPFDLAGLEDGE